MDSSRVEHRKLLIASSLSSLEAMSKLKSQLEVLEKEKREKEQLKYSEDEKAQATRIYNCLVNSWEQQNMPLDEFDGKTLRQVMEINRKVRNSFITPLMNDGEVRVVTGTAEGKVDTVFNAVFNQNLETEVRAYNEYDVEDYELGRKLSNAVKRTKQIERDEDINESALREILSMPAVFIQETNEDLWYYDRVLTKGNWDDLWNFQVPEFENKKWLRKREAKKVLWTADQVLLGSVKIPMRLFHLQPYIITYKIRNYEEAKAVYGQSPRWKYVQPGALQHEEVESKFETANWRFTQELANSDVEEIIYKSVFGDEMQVYLNGVNMLPVGCPFIGIGNKFKCYDMTMEGGKEINPKFAYRRPLVSMVATLQALKDEDFRLMILKRRQDIFHPVVTKAKSILSKDMWLPSAITYGISKSEIEDLMGDRSIDRSDQVMSEMIEKEIEKFINVPPILQGISGERQQTAHEIAQQMKQALINLGVALTAYIRMVRNCDYLRLYNILSNYTTPIDRRFSGEKNSSESVYRNYSIADVELYDGKIGTEVIQFIDRQLSPKEKEAVLSLEEKSRDEGRPKAFSFIDVNKLRAIPYLFYINVTITEKRSSLLERELFKKDLADAIELGNAVGVPVNGEYVTQEFAKRINLDSKRLYQVPMPALPPTMSEEEQMMNGGQMPNGKMPMKKVMDTSAMIPSKTA